MTDPVRFPELTLCKAPPEKQNQRDRIQAIRFFSSFGSLVSMIL